MTNKPAAPKKAKPTPAQVDPEPDAWARFEHAVDAALHTPPKHREPKPKGAASPKRKAERE